MKKERIFEEIDERMNTEGERKREGRGRKGPKWKISRARLLILTSDENSLRNYGEKEISKLGGGKR